VPSYINIKKYAWEKAERCRFSPLSGRIVRILFCINIRHYENISTFCGKFSRSGCIFGADGKTPAYKGGSFAQLVKGIKK